MARLDQTVTVAVSEQSQAGEARRVAASLARQAGFDEVQQGTLSIVVSEAARNQLQHARGGTILLQRLGSHEHRGLQMLALDRGPGMQNVAECLRDGYSTAGTSGTGLGAIRRLSQAFDIYSTPSAGTALLAQFWAQPTCKQPPPGWQVGGVCTSYVGEPECGDSWGVRIGRDALSVMVADGLGHGALAAEASVLAVGEFVSTSQPAETLLVDLHQKLQRTRGAAIGILDIDKHSKQASYWGVGNISATIVTRLRQRTTVSMHGTVGRELPRVRPFVYPWQDDALIVVHSDGISSRWHLKDYPGLVRRHPAVIAGVLFRDFQRSRDDVTVVAARFMPNLPTD